jgi:signal transduction histidine kinase
MRLSLYLLIECAVIVPTYLYTLLGPSGIVQTKHGWGAALLWTVVVVAFAVSLALFRWRIARQDARMAWLVATMALAAWIVWLAPLTAISVFVFYLLLGIAILYDRRLGRIVGVVSVAIVYLEAYLLVGRHDPTIYLTLLPWVAGLLFTATTMVLVNREEAARRHSDQLLAQLQSAHRQLQQYAAQVRELATVQERTRLAQELHDSVSQTLFSASLIADALPQLWTRRPEVARERTEDLRRLTRGALAEMRTLLLELRPGALTQMGLGDLLGQLTQAVSSRAQLPIDLVVQGQGRLPPEVQVALYRIVQEALNNIVKHAGASRVAVEACFEAQGVMVRVQDDGVGFDLAAIPAGHFGLGIMRERATAIGAALTVESVPDSGTTITVLWHAPQQEPAPA